MTAGMSRGKAVSAFFRCTGILRGRAGKTIERAACRRKLSRGPSVTASADASVSGFPRRHELTVFRHLIDSWLRFGALVVGRSCGRADIQGTRCNSGTAPPL